MAETARFRGENRLTLAERRYNLDVPSWEERPQAERQEDNSIAAQVAAAVR